MAYIYDTGSEVDIAPISEDATPSRLDGSRYQWTEGLQFGRPWLMFIWILPEDHTVINPLPRPAGTKIFTNRLALYWILKGDDVGRTKVELTIIKLPGDLESEIVQINKDFLSSEAVATTTIAVEDVAIILFLAADPSDASRLRLGQELREIQEKLQLAKMRDKFVLQQRMSVRPADISQALLDTGPRIVHFSGHGTSAGELCFENESGNIQTVQPDALAALFDLVSDQVDCVLLNACYSEIQAKAIANHIKYVIGMNKAIGDKAAISFAIGFYQALGAGRSVEEAYKFGCVQIRLQSIPEHLTPVLLKKKS